MQLSSALQSLADIGSITIRSKPLRDDESLERPCPRCKAPLALLNHNGDECPACGARIVRCCATFQPLPLVEFELSPGLSDDEAQALLEAEPLHLRNRCDAQCLFTLS
jgi:intraflagellar transport protein 122